MANPLRRYSRGLLAAQQGGLIPQYPEQGLLYNSVPAPAQAGTPQYAPPMSMGDYANELSYGLGKGVTNQLQGTYDMVAHPIDTARGLLDVASRPREWPAMAATAAGGLLKQATSSPAGFGQTVGELLSLKRPGVGAMRNDMTVYHGSPHNFDQFDIKKIGTGEGAQAYGHGLYVAESPAVAKTYQTMDGKFDYVPTSEEAAAKIKAATNYADNAAIGLRDALDTHNGDIGKAAKSLRLYAQQTTDPAYRDAYIKLADLADSGGISAKQSGNFYHVDLPDEHISNMLDWDKPLSEQPAGIQKAIKSKIANVNPDGLDVGGGRILRNGSIADGRAFPDKPYPWVLKTGNSVFGLSDSDVKRMVGEHVDSLSGEQAYARLSANMGGQPQASAFLNSIGIPGIRYLDGGSRTAKQGSRNYVVFDDKLLKILKKE